MSSSVASGRSKRSERSIKEVSSTISRSTTAKSTTSRRSRSSKRSKKSSSNASVRSFATEEKSLLSNGTSLKSHILHHNHNHNKDHRIHKDQSPLKDHISATSTTEEYSHSIVSDDVQRITQDHEFDAEGLKVKYLPWTDEETEQLLNQLSFLEKKLDDDIHWISKEHVREVERNVKSAVNKPGMLRRDDPLLENVSKMLRAIHLVDLDRLTKMMQKNQKAGNIMEGKDVLMLCGATGAGKTTTLHHLSGTTFREVEVDGFLHLHPTNFKDHSLHDYKTTCDREASTRNVQVSVVNLPTPTTVTDDENSSQEGSQEFVVCDVPAYDIANCVEEDIALGLGMVRALQRAKTIRPILVLSREGMGNRFSNLNESLEKVTGMCAVFDRKDLDAFNYVFTKYDEKHESLLHKQFFALVKNPPLEQEGNELFKAFAEDIATKTDPHANIVLPMDKEPHELLRRLSQNKILEADTKEFFPPFVSEFSLKQLQLQLQIIVHDLTTNLFKEDYAAAIRRMHLINELAAFFPEVDFYVKQGKDAFSRHVQQIWELVVTSIRIQDFGTALFRMEQLKKLAAEFPDAIKCSQQGQELLWESVAEPMGDKQYTKSIERMLQLNKLSNRFLDAGEGVQLGFEALRGRMIKTIAENEFDVAVDLIKQLSKVEHSMPEAFNVAQHGLHLLRESLLSLIKEENYDDGLFLTKRMSDLGRLFPEANACVRRVLKSIGKKIEKCLETEDFENAEFLLESLASLSPSLHDGSDCVEQTFDNVAQHICELRTDVVKSFEELLKVRNDSKFSQMLALATEGMDVLSKSEPTRIICTNYYQSENYQPVDEKPSHVEAMCNPSGCSNDEFCVSQVRHLSEQLSLDFPEFSEDEIKNMSNLMDHRNSLLSLMVRLKMTSSIMKQHSAGDQADDVYRQAFSKFYTLIENVLRVAEDSFQSSMEMTTFELQAWFLAFLIEGFIKDKVDIESEQRQKMEALDNRRVKLMLRFENEVYDTMDLIECYELPEVYRSDECKGSIKEFFDEVKLTELEAPRRLLLSLSSAPQLCKMLATKVDEDRAREPVAALDKGLVKFFAQVVAYLEQAYVEMLAMLKFDGTNIKGAGKTASALREDIVLARQQFNLVQNWSDDLKREIKTYGHRLNEIECCLAGAIDKLQERLDLEQDIGVAAFITSILWKSTALCRGTTDEDFSESGCSMGCKPEKEDLLRALPTLPPMAR